MSRRWGSHMPSTINGIGTSYVGRTDVHTFLGSCSKCHNYTQLTSYSTSLYFTFLFVPLIKLGGRRVMGICPSCTNHTVMKLRQFEAARDTAIPEAAQAYASRPNDAEAAGKLLALCSFFEDESTFLAATEQMETRFANHGDVLEGLAETYAFFNFPDAAVEAYERSIVAKDQPHVRGRLALMYLHLQRTEDAARIFQPLAEQQTQDHSPLARLIVTALGSDGHHEDALAMLDSFDHVSLDPKSKQANEQLRRKLLKAKEKGTPLKGDVLPSIDVKKPRESRVVGKVAVYIGPAIAAILFAAFIAVSIYKSYHREVYLINGLAEPYTVTINGTDTYNVVPRIPTRIALAEGTITVEGMYGSIPLPTESMDLHLNFFKRPFSTPLVVLNPDRVAPLVWEETSYAANASLANHHDYEYLTGEFVYERRRTDYLFEEFPTSISMSSQADVVTRDRFAIVRAPEIVRSDSRFFAEVSELGFERAIEALRIRTRYDLNDVAALGLLASTMSTEAFHGYMKAGLDVRPVAVELHLLYQQHRIAERRERALIDEYQQLLDADPRNGDLIYLRGSIEPDPAIRMDYFNRAATADQPSAFGSYALGVNAMMHGDFDAAMPLLKHALTLAPKSSTITTMLAINQLAMGNVDAYVASHNRSIGVYGYSYALVTELMAAFHHAERGHEADQVAQAYAADMLVENEMEQSEPIFARISAANAYCAGEMIAYLKFPIDDWAGIETVEVYLVRGDYDSAIRIAETFDDPQVHLDAVLLLYVALDSAGRHQESADHLEQAIAQLAEGGGDGARLAKILRDDTVPDVETLAALTSQIPAKRYWMLAAGQRFPAIRSECWALAKKLNVFRAPPAISIDTLIEGRPLTTLADHRGAVKFSR